LISTTVSSGTITDGSSTSAWSCVRYHAEPASTDTTPWGMASQPAGRASALTIRRAAQMSSGTSISITYLFSGSPLSSICAAVSSTAMANVGAAYTTACPGLFQRPGE